MLNCRNTAEARGLMFSWEEFCDLFQLFCMKVGADAAQLSSLKMILAHITEGHIGAFCILIDRIRSDCPFENYTEEQWQKQLIENVLMHQSLLDSLETNRGFPGYVLPPQTESNTCCYPSMHSCCQGKEKLLQYRSCFTHSTRLSWLDTTLKKAKVKSNPRSNECLLA